MAAAGGAPSFNSLSYPPQEHSQDTPPLSKRPKTPLQKHPLYPPAQAKLSLQFQEKILCLEIMGIDSGKALALNPSLHSTPLPSLHSTLSFLHSKGILPHDLPRIIGMCPQTLTLDVHTRLAPVFDFLSRDLHVPSHHYRRVINKCPRLLVSSAENQLKPALCWLRRLGFWDVEGLAYRDAVLLVSSVERTLMPKLEWLVGAGFTRAEAVAMVVRCPGLFTFSVERNFEPKFEYFVKEMGGELGELKEFPQYFAFSLEKRIKPRHLQAKACGVKLGLPDLLKSTDEEFELLIRQSPRA